MMLVISRKAGQTVYIGEQIKITVISCGNDKVTLGIDAPREVNIMRSELIETIQINKAAAEIIDQNSFNDIAALLKKR